MKNLIIWGASGHAKVILGSLDTKKYNIIAFIDRNHDINKFKNFPVLHSIEELLATINITELELHFIIAIGGKNGSDRMQIHNQLVDYGLKPLTVINPSAWIDPSAQIADGAQILGMSAISAEVKIGIQSIVNTNATIEHETIVGNGCHIMPAATVAGCVTIGDFCTVGSNATILPKISLKAYTMVGAGAVVTKDTEKNATVVGIPAKQIY